MSRFALLLFLFCTGAIAVSPDVPEIRRWFELNPDERKLPPLGDPLRKAMLLEVYLARTNTSLELQYGGRLDLLAIELGDEQMLRAYAVVNFTNRYGGVTRDSLRMLERTTEPGVIQAVSIYLDRAEPLKDIFAAEQIWLRPSVGAMHIMRHVLKQSEHFGRETREWAHAEFYRPLFEERAREEMRTFWAANAQHFATKNYQAVRPPGAQLGHQSDPKPVVNKLNNGPALPAIARPAAKRVAVGTAANVGPSPQIPTSAAAVPVVAVSSSPLWPWLLIGAGSIGGWLWWRSR